MQQHRQMPIALLPEYVDYIEGWLTEARPH